LLDKPSRKHSRERLGDVAIDAAVFAMPAALADAPPRESPSNCDPRRSLDHPQRVLSGCDRPPDDERLVQGTAVV
jgi:hypothetical protein